jgi:glyoxylase-like metal-dependent hydrolase (beta-lactamase superfamily II)
MFVLFRELEPIHILNGARISLGDFRITAIQAGVYYPDGGCMFGVIPKEQWARIMPPNESNRIALSLNCYVVESGEHTVVLDTGGGVGVASDAPMSGGLVAALTLPELIARAGIDPSAVDIVINSHLHWDHCGGNTTVRDGRIEPAFSRAKYYCSEAEWKHAQEIDLPPRN